LINSWPSTEYTRTRGFCNRVHGRRAASCKGGDLAVECHYLIRDSAVPISYKSDVSSNCTIRNFDVRQESPLRITVADAMLATMATPPFFRPVPVRKEGTTYEYISGDLALSNPIEAIVGEAYGAFGSGRHVSCLLSLGCGHPGVISAPEGSDVASWNQVLGKLVMESKETAERTESQMGHLGIYHRFSVDHGLSQSTPMVQPAPGDILAHTASYLTEGSTSRRLNLLLDTLRFREGVSSLQQLSECETPLQAYMVHTLTSFKGTLEGNDHPPPLSRH
jgi:hypothetical protein